MDTSELIVWGMVLGVIAAISLARLAALVMRPSASQARAVAYHVTVFMFVLALCGVHGQLWPELPPAVLHAVQVVLGPLCVGASNLWIRCWLRAPQRDSTMAIALHASALVLPLLGAACLLLPAAQQLPAAAALSLAGGILMLWLTVRAWLLGDPLAATMAAGSLLTLPAIAGLYATAMHLPAMGLGLQALTGLSAALSNAVTGLALWRRGRHETSARSQEVTPSQFDPVTRLHSGSTLVRKLIEAQQRRQRTRRDGAVLAVVVFDLERLAGEVGANGMNEMYVVLARRIRRQVGVVNTVGRYYDRCFITLVETIESPAWLRTVGLRLASGLRRPIRVTGRDGQPVEIRVDIGVGLVHLRPGHLPVEDVLDEAQAMAQAARTTASRTAIFDAASDTVLPVECARLGQRRRSPRRPRALPSVLPT
jgi:GGDEF domain-containing protein